MRVCFVFKRINHNTCKVLFVLYALICYQIPCIGDEPTISNQNDIIKKSEINYSKNIHNNQIFEDDMDECIDDGKEEHFNSVKKYSQIILIVLILVIVYLSTLIFLLFKKKIRFFFSKRNLVYGTIGFLILISFVWFIQSGYSIMGNSISQYFKTIPAIAHWGMFFILFFINIICLIHLFFSHENRHINKIPRILVTGMIAGLANMSLVYIISNSIFMKIPIVELIFTFLILLIIDFISKRYFQIETAKITNSVTYDLRILLIDKIFSCNYQKFEKIDIGKIYSIVDDDTETVGSSTSIITDFSINLVILISGIIYLAYVSWIATIGTFLLIAILSLLFNLLSKKLEKQFKIVREIQGTFLKCIDNTVKGYKELIINREKKEAFKSEFNSTTSAYSNKILETNTRLININVFGDGIVMILLGGVSLLLPQIIPTLTKSSLISFLMIMMYLIAPIIVVTTIMPDLSGIRVSYRRIKDFIATLTLSDSLSELKMKEKSDQNKDIESLCISKLSFSYKETDVPFSIGPLDLEFKKGEITFVIGGNGSGKTTFAKLLTGLYVPDSGSISINGKDVCSEDIGNYFSVVFNDGHLFEKIYNVSLDGRDDEVTKFISLLKLPSGVSISENKFSTIELSNGQRKRLALLKCFLENKPIFLFDEVAADQDPQFRKFFYNTLIQKMRQDGKIVIAITHDDHYFNVADKIIKFDMGKVEFINKGNVSIAIEKIL